MRKFLQFILIALISVPVWSQKTFSKNTFYAELGGDGLTLSANYERQVLDKPGLGLHIGAGLGNSRPTIPMGINYLFQFKNTKSYIESGACITLAEENILNDIFADKSTTYRLAYIPSIGFRHHTNYGLMWKIIYSPFFTKYRNWIAYGGISIGWRI